MIKFNEDQIGKYKKSVIGGTGYLAFRDIELFAKKYNTDLSYVLDLGCGSGQLFSASALTQQGQGVLI